MDKTKQKNIKNDVGNELEVINGAAPVGPADFNLSECKVPPIRNSEELCSHFENINKTNVHTVGTVDDLPSQFFRHTLDDKSDFLENLHKSQHYGAHRMSNWMSEGTCCIKKTLSFHAPIFPFLSTKDAKVEQNLKCCFLNPENMVLEATSVIKDVLYADSFYLVNTFQVQADPSKPGCSSVKISSEVKWTKSLWLVQGVIEKSLLDALKVYCQSWMTLAAATIQEKKQDEKKNLLLAQQAQLALQKTQEEEEEAAQNTDLHIQNSTAKTSNPNPTISSKPNELFDPKLVKMILLAVLYVAFLWFILSLVPHYKSDNLRPSQETRVLMEMTRLNTFHDEGLLTDIEYNALRDKLITSTHFLNWKQRMIPS